MTEAGWTADKPNASGWYWNRINGTVGIALIMRRDCQLYAWLRFKDAWLSREGWLDYIHGEWLGPITPDSYQQGRVAGIMEAEREMYRLEERTSTNCAQDLLDFYRWCAQQAQEGGVGE